MAAKRQVDEGSWALRAFQALVLVTTLLVAVWFLLRWTLVTPPAAAMPIFQTLDRPLVIAHQGGDGIQPGNTLEAFIHAWELGVPMSEGDLHTSADDFLVLIHDDTVDAHSEGSGRIRDLTLDQLQQLDAGYRWTPDGGGTFPYRGQGIRIPSLDELLDTLPDAYFNLELKQTEPSVAGPACNTIRERGLENRTLMASFSSRALREFRTLCPEVATSAGAWEARAFLALHHLRLTRIWTPPFQAIQLPPRSRGIPIITPRLIRSARDRGLEVHAWTINDSDEVRALLRLGVDGIVTDHPERMLEVLQERGSMSSNPGIP
jgi:glycerophosphoryl diester phosphodiesterase